MRSTRCFNKALGRYLVLLALVTIILRAAEPERRWKQVHIEESKAAFWLRPGDHVLIRLFSGEQLRGEVREVEQEGLYVGPLSKPATQQEQYYAFRQIESVQVTGYRSKLRKGLPGALAASTFFGLLLTFGAAEKGSWAAIVLAPIGTAVAAYFVGKKLDREYLEIRVLHSQPRRNAMELDGSQFVLKGSGGWAPEVELPGTNGLAFRLFRRMRTGRVVPGMPARRPVGGGTVSFGSR